MFAKKSHTAPININESHRTHVKTWLFPSKCDASQPSRVPPPGQEGQVWEAWYAESQPGVASTPNLLAQTEALSPLATLKPSGEDSPGPSPQTPSHSTAKRWRLFSMKKTVDNPKRHPDIQTRKPAPKLLKKPKKSKSTADLNEHIHANPSTFMTHHVPPVPNLCEHPSPPAPETPTPETPTHDEDPPIYFVVDVDWDLSPSDVNSLFISCSPFGLDEEVPRVSTRQYNAKRFKREVFIRGPPSAEMISSHFLERRPSWARSEQGLM